MSCEGKDKATISLYQGSRLIDRIESRNPPVSTSCTPIFGSILDSQGQCETLYTVVWNHKQRDSCVIDAVYTKEDVLGPIRGFSTTYAYGDYFAWYLDYGASGNRELLDSLGPNPARCSYEIVSITRQDGQPDNCGSSSPSSFTFEITDSTGVIYSKVVNRCPEVKIGCDDGCPPGYLKCESDDYPGYCCIDCEGVARQLNNIREQLRKL